MSTDGMDRTTNDQLAAHLSRQDTRLDELFRMFDESNADRVALRQLSDGHEQRIAGLEARMTVREAQDARVARAISVQLRLSDWWEAHKVRANLAAVGAIVVVPIISGFVQAILRHFGWL